MTFTRKAAGELATRIRAKLAALQRIAAADTQNRVFPAGLLSTDALEPKVSTYHSYASGIVSDYGLRLGVERDVVLLGGAQSFQLASEVVEAFDGDYEHFRSAKSTLVKAVIQLAGECAEHLQDPAGVRGWLLDRVAEFEALPYLATAKKNPSQAVGGAQRAAAHPGQRRGDGGTLHGRQACPRRPRLRRPRGPRRARRQGDPDCRGHRTPALQGGAPGRVPGHLARPAGAFFPAVRRRPRSHRRGGSEPVHLRLPRRLRRPALPLCPRIPGPAPRRRRQHRRRGQHRRRRQHGRHCRHGRRCRRLCRCPLCRRPDVVPHHGVAQRPDHPLRRQRHFRTAQQSRSPDRPGRRAGHRRGCRGSPAAAQPGSGPGPRGDGTVWHRRGRGRGHRRGRAEVQGD